MSWQCLHCKEAHEDAFDSCWKCGRERIVGVTFSPFTAPTLPGQQPMTELPCATTTYLPGREILETRGIVCGEAILATDAFEDFAAGFEASGSRSETYEGTLRDARRTALVQMMKEAAVSGADGVVGVAFAYETVGRFLLVCVSGTTVVLKPVE